MKLVLTATALMISTGMSFGQQAVDPHSRPVPEPLHQPVAPTPKLDASKSVTLSMQQLQLLLEYQDAKSKADALGAIAAPIMADVARQASVTESSAAKHSSPASQPATANQAAPAN